ncbi:sigma-70 family RNA polymerase sigma factor [Subtercola endophyticus]|uniref:sigma-70 family RNA polymerase sigma factor n=1 Tax=Subtercola endophyticus TaxID=2895559 RepID=UPI001E49EB23|nr:sigma-70 family RNA polymerase sigma factor [Subtercola endophyticus]UFS59013.1 sigma-70 family RNA polymerase sigma factor [Subtercola endophyticus]
MGNEQADVLRSLHDEYAPALYRYVVRMTNDRQWAEDVVQETLFRAWRSPSIQSTDDSAQAWLFTVARNLVIDEWRSARSRNEIGTATVPERAKADHTDAVLQAWLVSDALTELTREHREVLVHSYYGGKTVAEIAEHLGIPDGTVKSRLHYALRALRLALQEKGVTR